MSQDPVLSQLNRAAGQLSGIQKMYEEGRPCLEVVRQIAATRSSLARTARDLLSCEAVQCSKEKRVDDLDALVQELFKYE